ncbi:hypothetical protein GCM10010377_69740 [Streptomyces viridiviolaceus]|uniref:Uncharacterized protein n=1 Tax=Streptomyces viridiviolaceus TaxID=68282 RepID=A0ABW2EBY5_9ACTN|nr:hypothetical protein [Streptomyces viridiviolaceus]GHB69023.1 hypothetical protein GCM10010377_69740 [Streptomyces viridiviolaceus]
MSRPSQYDDGANGETPATVYVPQSVPPPAYDEYSDPAAAHGWQNAYDRTEELPPVRQAPDVRPRTTSRGARRKPRSAWRSRRAAVAVGAVGAASAAALIAGFSFSGPGGSANGKDGVSPTAPDVGAPPGAGAPDEVDPARSPAAGTGATTPGPGPSGSPSPERSGAASSAPPPPADTAPTAPADSATSPADGPGNSLDNPGRGQRGGKGPK